MINPPIYRLTTAVSDIDQTNINRDIRDGNWLSKQCCCFGMMLDKLCCIILQEKAGKLAIDSFCNLLRPPSLLAAF